MAPTSSIEKLPLHVTSGILAQLDTIAQLSLVVRSHRIFHDAFNENSQTVARSVVLNQIPPGMFPYAAALLHSIHVNPSKHDAVRELLSQLETTLTSNNTKIGQLSHYPLSAYAALSRDLSAVEILRNDMVAETLPLFKSRFEFDHTPEASDQELYRLNRAFLRYQLMCNLFCIPCKVGRPLSCEEITRCFFSSFSPWVNEQMLCVYAYLERKVAEAFDDVAAHDVDHGEMPIDWEEDGTESSHIQSHLCRGLPFLVAVLRARTFGERESLLPMHPKPKRYYDSVPFEILRLMMPEKAFVDELNPVEWWVPLSECSSSNIAKLSTPLDGERDALSSNPCQLWLQAHKEDEVYEIVVDKYFSKALWECAYLIWDWEQTTDLERRCAAVSNMKLFFPRARLSWTIEEFRLSEMQRTCIWLFGGHGYWPRRRRSDEHFDFSGISGIEENDEAKLIVKFRIEEKKIIDELRNL
ncbi:hypothetical protein CkaCkLH20_12674 [Colletotrichum karsti]|uniref:Uncharacterized protein n=1 Tax=Colletotrichum karsti TaxID=1095194 RepID=A0A9P6I0Z0_9PEZI|nr:uncharacterized protein CkaCkLH20_12674 [Colletotrichum karsti]KAF9869875.1 hypothetical protein CkaCkLH20_12674 [Colletotrichum karsti]